MEEYKTFHTIRVISGKNTPENGKRLTQQRIDKTVAATY